MKLVTVIGARPQFIKAAVLSREIAKFNVELGGSAVEEVIVHTGQHYDENMSQIFFDQMGIPAPSYSLNIGGSGHGAMTGDMLKAIEMILVKEKPDCLLVYGDTNSTLAGALAATKLLIPVAHVEAGLRSFNKEMPEEINRLLTDHISEYLFCPTQTAIDNLSNEGIKALSLNVGDVMYDASLYYRELAMRESDIVNKLGLVGEKFILATCHRQENTDNRPKLAGIVDALSLLSNEYKVIFPVHPRTKKMLGEFGLDKNLGNVLLTEPLPFLDMVQLEERSSLILTDSGGVQKEAYFFNVPCVTMREETEWVETVEAGVNYLAGSSCDAIIEAVHSLLNKSCDFSESLYGTGHAGKEILGTLFEKLSNNA